MPVASGKETVLVVLNGRTELCVFDRDYVPGDRNDKEGILPHVRRFRGAIGPDFVFMEDNARPTPDC
ncbi:hypothetical protein TNCV_3690011 [Trichonephila clavipes]|uniref:Transposase n=1 Tax=Trichonephila clavipes TaxID=2585209 RepID=A0A8X6VQ04_TRICX|nr:hypothetical protein TNCV_3690011 [Trichonephila clavipes]